MKEQKEKYVRMAKKMFDENNMDLWEMKVDVWMHKWMRVGRLDRFLRFAFIRDVLNSSFVIDTNAKLHLVIRNIFIVLGWVFIITGIAGMFHFLVDLTGLHFVFSFGFFMGIRILLYILITFASSLIAFLMGVGMLRKKVWVPFLTVVQCGLAVCCFVVSFVPTGFYESTSYGTFGSSLVNLILTFILFVVVIKNKQLFSA